MATDDQGRQNDMELRGRILSGISACGELEVRFRQPLERFLVGLCGMDDGRSRQKAVEIASQVLEDCFRKIPSLLEKWSGEGPLEAFLRKAGENRLKSWWRSAEKSRITVNSDSDSMRLAVAAGADEMIEGSEILLAQKALEEGVGEAMEKAPEGLAFLRLKGLHGVDQRMIAKCWGIDESGISRRIAAAMEMIRKRAAESAEARGEELSFSVFQRALQFDPSVLLGRTGTGSVPPVDEALLEQVISGGGGKQERVLAAMAMCRDSRNLALFAALLGREEAGTVVVAKDGELDGMGARLSECVSRSLDLMRPCDVAGIIPPETVHLFGDMLPLVGAEGGTLWWLVAGEAVLEAALNPLEPGMLGRKQPLVSGIISLVLATGEPVHVGDISSHGSHSPAIDLSMGKSTRGMIAVPFRAGGVTRGVLTAVSFTERTMPGIHGVEIFSRWAGAMAGMLERVIEKKILES